MSRRLLPSVLLAALMVGLGVPERHAGAEQPVAYGPVPPSIAAVIADAQEQALANLALGLLKQIDAGGVAAPRPEWPRSLLVMLGDVGLKAVAEQLAGGSPSDAAKLHLLAVVAASEHPDAEALLMRAAGEPLPSLRMVAAQGLGRGRGAAAVPTLATLAQDARSGVRAAALRSLFAIPSPQAAAARRGLPADVIPELHAERLRRHRQVGDAGPELLALALTSYRDGRRARVRQEAARLLTEPALGASVETLERIVLEMGTDVLGAAYVRYGLRVPFRGYDAVTERRTAIAAALTLIGHDDATEAQRMAAIERAVGWIARPVPMDPYTSDPIPEEVLRQRLPDVGLRLIEPVERRLRKGQFYVTANGVGLLRDVGPDAALPVFERLLLAPDVNAVHGSAADVMAGWGRVGGEEVANRLLAADVEYGVKRSVIEGLRAEPATWALPLLRTLLQGADEDLAREARLTLERRPEPTAREWLVEEVFRDPTDVEDRLPQLLRPIDAYAWKVLARAMTDARYVLRHEALVPLARPSYRDPRGAALLAEHELDITKPRQVQDYLYALINQNPMEAVRFVRSRWAELPEPRKSLRLLQEIWGSAATRAAVDLALELVADSADPVLMTKAGAVLAGHAGYRDEEIGKLWRRTLEWRKDDIRTGALRHIAYPGCPPLSDLLVPMLENARKRRGLLEDSSELDEATRAQQVLTAMAHQTWAWVEPAVVRALVDPVAHPEVRVHAAEVAIGRLSDGARAQLVTWLAGVSADPNAKAKGADAGAVLQFKVAQAVGTGGDATTAGRLYRALAEEHAAFYGLALRLDPAYARSTAFENRVLALATGVTMTQHEPSVRAMTDLLLAPPYSTYANRAIALQLDQSYRGGPSSGSRRTAPLDELLHANERAIGIMPPDAVSLLSALRLVPDAMLVRGLQATLENGRRSGALGMFPDMYLYRIARGLSDGRTGPARREAAAVVTSFAGRLLPVRGPADFALGRQSVAALARAGRLAEAVIRQRSVLQILAQRGYEDDDERLWARERALLDALEGRALAARDMQDLARDAFRRAVMRAPNDPRTLMLTAVQRAEAGFDLEAAEQTARRALRLHARSRHEPDVAFVDGLAQVLVRANKAAEAVALLEPRMEHKVRLETGRYQLHLAQAYLAIGDEAMAARSLLYALDQEPGLEPEIMTDPRFAAWRTDGRLQKIAEQARRQRREGF